MTICSHTGLAIPECSCSACIREQLERHHQPPLGATPGTPAEPARASVIKRIAARARRPRQRSLA